MPNILLTGAAGYIGSHVAKLLHQHGYTPITVDNLSTGHYEAVKRGPFHQIDILDTQAIKSLLLQCHPVAVMHFAASALVGESMRNPEAYYRNNVTGSLSLFRAILETSVIPVVFSSTCAVYGNADSIKITERTPTNPINPYGRSKLMVESILADFEKAYGLKSVCLRYFNAAGADLEGELGENHSPETHLIPNVLKAALGKIPSLSLFGGDYDTPDGTCVRDYLHVQDIARAHLLALQRLLAGGPCFTGNLGTGQGLSNMEILKAVEWITGKPVPFQMTPRREGDPASLVCDASKAERELGWVPKFSDLDTIISSAYSWEMKRKTMLLP